VKQIGDRTNGGFRNPAFMLLLNPPENGDRCRSLPAFRIFGDLLFRPRQIVRRKLETRRLNFLWRTDFF